MRNLKKTIKTIKATPLTVIRIFMGGSSDMNILKYSSFHIDDFTHYKRVLDG